MQSYRELIVWQKAIGWAKALYQVTQRFPDAERYGLTGQIRRAAVSVAANIAEGQGRNSPGDYVRFVSIANGSRQEVETEIIIAAELGYLTPTERDMLLSQGEEIGRMLTALRHALERKRNTP